MIEDLYELCGYVEDSLAETNERIRSGGGKVSQADYEYLDKLSHTLKSLKTVIAMEEAADDYSGADYSGNRSGNRGQRTRDNGRVSRGGSYARGRGSNAPRDRNGRYSGEQGYSRTDAMMDMADDIRESMQDMPESLKREAQKFLSKLEQNM